MRQGKNGQPTWRDQHAGNAEWQLTDDSDLLKDRFSKADRLPRGKSPEGAEKGESSLQDFLAEDMRRFFGQQSDASVFFHAAALDGIVFWLSIFIACVLWVPLTSQLLSLAEASVKDFVNAVRDGWSTEAMGLKAREEVQNMSWMGRQSFKRFLKAVAADVDACHEAV